MDRRPTVSLTLIVSLALGAVAPAEEAAAPPPALKTFGPAAGEPAEPAPETPAPASTTLLMDALGAVGAGKPLDNLGLLIYGWVEGGFTGRLMGGQDPLVARVFDANKPNNLRLQQLKLTIERPIDRTKTFDLGARTDFLYGTDARFIHALGLTDRTCREDTQVDIEQLYVQAFVGKGNKDGEGMDITFGKWVTPFGAEVIDAPANLLYSRGLLFNYAIPFTHTGVKANYTFSPQASAYAAVARGWDNFSDSNDSASFMVGGTLGTREEVCAGTPRAGLALNVITGPEQKDDSRDYRTVVDLVGTYRWTEKLTQVVNFDHGTEENGAGASAAHWSGIAHYVTYGFTDCLSGTVRAEWFQDTNGVRTGVQGNLYEITAGVTIQPLPKDAIFKNLYVRPELRWDFTDQDGAFGGGRHHQLTAGFDVIFKF